MNDALPFVFLLNKKECKNTSIARARVKRWMFALGIRGFKFICKFQLNFDEKLNALPTVYKRIVVPQPSALSLNIFESVKSNRK